MKCKLYTDGAARGNPGPAGAGAILFDASGEPLKKMRKYLGEMTNNLAEYHALIIGLVGAKEEGVSELHIFADSELMVRQVNGQYKVKNEGIKPLFNEVKKALMGFKAYTISHVPREQNKDADKLANEAIDNAL